MASSRQIDAADTRYKRKPAKAFNEGVDQTHVLANPRGSDLFEALERDLARLHIRRLANRHGCSGRCDEPEHAEDVEAAAEWLDALFGELNPTRGRGR